MRTSRKNAGEYIWFSFFFLFHSKSICYKDEDIPGFIWAVVVKIIYSSYLPYHCPDQKQNLLILHKGQHFPTFFFFLLFEKLLNRRQHQRNCIKLWLFGYLITGFISEVVFIMCIGGMGIFQVIYRAEVLYFKKLTLLTYIFDWCSWGAR